MTEQRRVIARVLAAAEDHPDVEELYRRCSAIDDRISISTVYRTVKLFEDAGIIERHDFRDGRARYEQMPEAHHDHLINLRTGEVIEFQSEEIERLQAEVARRLGYKLVDHRLELYAVPLDDKSPPLSARAGMRLRTAILGLSRAANPAEPACHRPTRRGRVARHGQMPTSLILLAKARPGRARAKASRPDRHERSPQGPYQVLRLPDERLRFASYGGHACARRLCRDRDARRRRSRHPQHLPHPREGGREGLFRARPHPRA